MKTDAYEHADARRKNIPTSEDHVYMGDEERTGELFSPSPVGSQGPVLLSWQRGKNIREIQTDALPLYIHEKVQRPLSSNFRNPRNSRAQRAISSAGSTASLPKPSTTGTTTRGTGRIA